MVAVGMKRVSVSEPARIPTPQIEILLPNPKTGPDLFLKLRLHFCTEFEAPNDGHKLSPIIFLALSIQSPLSHGRHEISEDLLVLCR
jgi:hypothetical protein